MICSFLNVIGPHMIPFKWIYCYYEIIPPQNGGELNNRHYQLLHYGLQPTNCARAEIQMQINYIILLFAAMDIYYLVLKLLCCGRILDTVVLLMAKL